MNKFSAVRHKNKTRGFSLIELLLVLAIVSALVVAAFIVYPKVQAGRNAAYEAQNLVTIQSTVRSLFTTGIYTRVSMELTMRHTMFPAHMVDPTNWPKTQWGGDAGVGAAGPDGIYPGDGVRARYFRIFYNDLLPGLNAGEEVISFQLSIQNGKD